MTDDRIDLPWFKFHVGDYLRVTRAWPPVARCAYVELLAAQWDRGALPIDATELRAFVPGLTDAEFATCWPLIEIAFPSDGSARSNAAFAKARETQMRDRQSRRGIAKRAAAERWRNRTGINPSASSNASSTPEDA